jgi:serine/threonine-protein kinase
MGSDPISRGSLLLDRYRVVERIAAGGASVVYRATDERLLRPVAVKVFTSIGAGTGAWRTAYEHFVQEAFSLSTLSHPSTLRIYDFGEVDGVPFQVTEFLDGGTLSDLVRNEGSIARNEIVDILRAIEGSLTEAHARGIVHRDIKPANIVFVGHGRERRAKLTDFGIAKVLAGENRPVDGSRAQDTHISVGSRVGMYSPHWSAPEQFAGGEVDATADIYSLSLVVVYMLTGQVAMLSRTAEEAVRRRRSSDELIAAALADAKVNGSLVEQLQSACSFRRSYRPASVAEFCDRVVDHLRGQRRDGLRGQRRFARGSGRYAPLQEDESTVVDMDAGAELLVGTRRVQSVRFDGEPVLLTCAGGRARVRVSLIDAGNHAALLHVKGVNCFVARGQGRCAPAVQVSGSERLTLVATDREVLARAYASFGTHDGKRTIFDLGGAPFAVADTDCRDAVALDLGAESPYVLVFRGTSATSRRAPRGNR